MAIGNVNSRRNVPQQKPKVQSRPQPKPKSKPQSKPIPIGQRNDSTYRVTNTPQLNNGIAGIYNARKGQIGLAPTSPGEEDKLHPLSFIKSKINKMYKEKLNGSSIIEKYKKVQNKTKWGRRLDYLDDLTSKNGKVGKYFNKIQDFDIKYSNKLAKGTFNIVENGLNKFSSKAASKFGSLTMRYQSEGIINTIRGKSFWHKKLNAINWNNLVKAYNGLDGKFKITSRASKWFNSGKGALSKIGTSGKFGLLSKGINLGKGVLKNPAMMAKIGLGCRVFCRCNTVLQVGLACYELGSAAVEGYKKGGVWGATKAVGKKSFEVGGGLAGGIAGAKIGAVVGSFIPIPGATLVCAAAFAACGYIAGSKVGKEIGKGIRAAGKWVADKAKQGWNDFKSSAKQGWNNFKANAKKAWNSAKKVGKAALRVATAPIRGAIKAGKAAWHAVTHPVQTAKKVFNAVTHPVQTAKKVGNAIASGAKKAWNALTSW